MTTTSLPDVFEQYSRTRTQRTMAEELGRTTRTIQRWVNGSTPVPHDAVLHMQRLLQPPNHVPPADFTFVDLFAGIGGTRLGFEAARGECVFTSEWDSFARQTYAVNFQNTEDHQFAGDITKVDADKIPDHDVLVAGFPCQPFSIAGVSKKNSLKRAHGFLDETQGTLFFDVARIIDAKRPKAFLLENVRNLVSHDHGLTFKVILRTLEEELGYDVHYQVLDASAWVPQGRKRIFIVGFRRPTEFSFDDIRVPDEPPTMAKVLHPEDGSEKPQPPFTDEAGRVSEKYVLSDRLWEYLQNYKKKHESQGNGFGFGLVDSTSVARTLSARYFKDGSEILVSRGRGNNPRRLTPRECARLMGFHEGFRIPVSDTQAYRQFGNSVVVPVVKELARLIASKLD